MNKSSIALLFSTTMLLLLCCGEAKSDKESAIRPLPPSKTVEVTTMSLSKRTFEHELVSNGKITAKNVAELKFHLTEIISDVFVRNGTKVRKGEVIASLNTYVLKQALNQAKDALDRSKLEYQDVLIGQGYKVNQVGSIPDDIEQLAKVKSGYNTAQTQYDIALYNLQQAKLTAPFDGIVANLFTKANTMSSPSTVLCNIIDTHSLEVMFNVLESEVDFIHLNDKIIVAPFSAPNTKVEGRVSEINPWIDEKGMLKIKATVSYNERLVEGMNVRVHIFRSAGKQWVVPKSAVVSRTGKQVVFTLVDGKSNWNYVETGLENADYYTITSETLKDGDQVIINGNVDLSHGTPVNIAQLNTKKQP